MEFDTRLVTKSSLEGILDDPYRANALPLYQTATFAQASATDCGPYDYTRSGNPTRRALEVALAELEGGARALAYTSGMAALSGLTRLVLPGQRILAGEDLYGGTFRLLDRVLRPRGVQVDFVDASDPSAVHDALTPATRLVLVETPTNPLQKICDLRALADLAHRNDALFAVDNTLLSPCLQRPLECGADVVVHSATKHLGGHSDLTAGCLVVRDGSLGDELAFLQNADGTGLAPFEAWLLARGLKTLVVRMARAQETAGLVARALERNPAVAAVHYPGLDRHPDRDVHESQASGAGALISFETGDVRTSQRVVEALRLFSISVSFGSVSSLASLPCRMSHASIPEAVRQARALPEDLVRLSIGLEAPGDLIADLESALELAAHATPTGAVCP